MFLSIERTWSSGLFSMPNSISLSIFELRWSSFQGMLWIWSNTDLSSVVAIYAITDNFTLVCDTHMLWCHWKNGPQKHWSTQNFFCVKYAWTGHFVLGFNVVFLQQVWEHHYTINVYYLNHGTPIAKVYAAIFVLCYIVQLQHMKVNQ